MNDREMKLTVFTPTYNRAYILPELYESLKRQTNQAFIWIVVDDGSTDNTKQLVEDWEKAGEIQIQYHYQENAGKMQAHNKGVELCNTEMFVCVDSDDYLVDDAVDQLIMVWQEKHISDDPQIAGVIAKRGGKNGKMLGRRDFPNEAFGTVVGVSEHIQGDTTLCFKTSTLRNYQFPFVLGEKFITEAYIYKQIDQNYRYFLYPEILTICEYLPDGYTKQGGRVGYQNPVGRMYYEALCIHLDKGEKRWIAAAKYNMYKYLSKHKDVDSFNMYERFVLCITFPMSILFAKKKRGEYGNV